MKRKEIEKLMENWTFNSVMEIAVAKSSARSCSDGSNGVELEVAAMASNGGIGFNDGIWKTRLKKKRSYGYGGRDWEFLLIRDFMACSMVEMWNTGMWILLSSQFTDVLDGGLTHGSNGPNPQRYGAWGPNQPSIKVGHNNWGLTCWGLVSWPTSWG